MSMQQVHSRAAIYYNSKTAVVIIAGHCSKVQDNLGKLRVNAWSVADWVGN